MPQKITNNKDGYSDGFNPFKCLSDTVASHGRIQASRVYENPENRIFHWVNTMISNVKKAIHGTYHSASPKHLPRYLAEFYFRFNNRFTVGIMEGKNIKFAVKVQPELLRNFTQAEEQV